MNIVVIFAFLAAVFILIYQYLEGKNKKQALVIFLTREGRSNASYLRKLECALAPNGYNVKLLFMPSKIYMQTLLWYYKRSTSDKLLIFYIGDYTKVGKEEGVRLGPNEVYLSKDFFNSLSGKKEKPTVTIISIVTNYSPTIPIPFDFDVFSSEERERRFHNVASVSIATTEEACESVFDNILGKLHGIEGDLCSYQKMGMYASYIDDVNNYKVCWVPEGLSTDTVL